MMLILWNVFVNAEDIASDPSSSTLINATLLSWFLNVVTTNLRMSKGGHLLLNGNTKWYEVSEHIATKVGVNPRTLSKTKNAKYIWIMNPGANFETLVIFPLWILVALARRQIGQSSSMLGRFYGITSMVSFLVIYFSLVIETRPKCWWIS